MNKLAFSALTLTALMAGQVLAQGQVVPPRGPQKPLPAQPAQPSAASNTQQLEQHAAACLVIGNEEEIAMSEFGEEHAKSDDVKEFCREMSKEHTKFISKLRKFTPQQAASDVTVKTDDAKVAAKPAAHSGGSMMDQMLALKRDKAQQCLAISKEELSAKKGADFDKCFMSAQIGAHIGMLAELRALKGKTSGEFNELVSEGEKSAKAHLDHAKKVMEQVASSDKN